MGFEKTFFFFKLGLKNVIKNVSFVFFYTCFRGLGGWRKGALKKVEQCGVCVVALKAHLGII